MTVPNGTFGVLSQAHDSTGIALGRIRDAAIAASQRARQAESRRCKGANCAAQAPRADALRDRLNAMRPN